MDNKNEIEIIKAHDLIAQTDKNMFNQWLLDPESLALSEEAKRVCTPKKLLQHFSHQPVRTQHGYMPAMAAVIAKLYEKALSGNMSAIDKIYNELEHDGVQRTETNNFHAFYSAEAVAVLEQHNLLDITPEEVQPAAIEDKPATTPLENSNGQLSDEEFAKLFE